MIKCIYFDTQQCNSCNFMDIGYAKSIAVKQQICDNAFAGIVNPIVPSDYVIQSRNKAKIGVLGSVDEPIFGFLDRDGNAHDIVHCPLHLADINSLLSLIKDNLKNYKLIPYDIITRRGELKYLLVTQSEQTQEIMLRFVLRSSESTPRIKKLFKEVLKDKFAQLKVLTVNIQPEPKAVLEGQKEIYLTDATVINADLDDVKLVLGTRSFFQINSNVAIKLYRQVGQILDNIQSKSLLDLYCGVGAFALFAAQSNRNVLGVEISKEAIRCANLAKQQHKASKCIEFIADDVSNFIKNNSRFFDVVLVNPPRRGLNDIIIKHIIKLSPEHIIYSSCNIKTLKRDINELSSQYVLMEITPFDMFAMTAHIECLALFKKRI